MQQQVEEYPDKIPYISSTDRKKIRQWKAKYQELTHKNNSAREKIKTMKKKVNKVEKSYPELQEIHQTKNTLENIKKNYRK